MSLAVRALPAWREALDAARRVNADQPSYVQLATVQPDGRPANRTVVCRGFAPLLPHALLIATDRRAAKTGAAWAEVVWYLGVTREQFRCVALTSRRRRVDVGRMLGRVLLVPDPRWGAAPTADGVDWEQQRRAVWRAMSDRGRAGFAGGPPGVPITDQRDQQPPPAAVALADETAADNARRVTYDAALAQFALLVVLVERVDVLDLRPWPQRRVVHERDEGGGEWRATPVYA